MRYTIFEAFTNYDVGKPIKDLDITDIALDIGYPIYIVDTQNPNELYQQTFFGADLTVIDVPQTFDGAVSDLPPNVISYFLTNRLILGDL